MIDQQRMFAGPAQACLGGQGTLQYGCRVDKGPSLQLLCPLFDTVRELFQALAHHLVIIPTQGITADITQFGVAQHTGNGRLFWQIIHAYRNYPQGAGQQLVWARTHHAMAGHILHVTVISLGEPVGQQGFVLRQVGIGNNDLAKA